MSTAARVRTDPRISRRRQAIARGRRRRMFGSLLAVAAFALAAWIAFWSPLLMVREVKVVGGRNVDPVEVASIAGLDSDDNLLLVSPTQVASKVEELPWVRGAKVDRRLPGTVRVRVVERKPAVVLSSDGQQWTLDRMGNVLAEGAVTEGLPALAGIDLAAVSAGERVTDPAMRDALAAWRSLSPKIRAQVAAVLAPTPERITLSFEDGTQVRYGAARSMHAKNKVLAALLAELRAEGGVAGYIDVRVPTNPAVSAAATTAGATPTASPTP